MSLFPQDLGSASQRSLDTIPLHRLPQTVRSPNCEESSISPLGLFLLSPKDCRRSTDPRSTDSDRAFPLPFCTTPPLFPHFHQLATIVKSKTKHQMRAASDIGNGEN
ncbi:hypothetical protein DdX_22101 [Ditylenchus destructor]|uniref:Uncharacterized protein n=1 Tax=Ditylenchus destructor TaxID=166010 RepID=A0AAD4MEU5_9BILA|nr:hypothetical protein DdX_22101 [Ditylenchus destructor]